MSKLKDLWLAPVPRLKPTIVRVEDHDRRAFTQGLAVVEGNLFESTGLENHSSLRQITTGSTEPESIKPLVGYFGEGIAYNHNEITQLTWKSGLAFVYSYPELENKRLIRYEGEGWGLAAYNDGFVMSDGSSCLTFRDSDFNITKKIRVKVRGLSLKWLNDLEYVNGHIYANRLGDNNIYKINAGTGKVVRIIDCSELFRIAAPVGPDSVLNGIAFFAEEKIFALTGKRWPKLFYVSLPTDLIIL